MVIAFIGDKGKIDEESVGRDIDIFLGRIMNHYDIDACYVCNEGEFDAVALKAVERAKERQPNIKCILLPLPNGMEYDETFYDEVKKDAFNKEPLHYGNILRNQYMVEESDILISHEAYSCDVTEVFRAKALAKAMKKTVYEV